LTLSEYFRILKSFGISTEDAINPQKPIYLWEQKDDRGNLKYTIMYKAGPAIKIEVLELLRGNLP